jgi:hypothetical protein
VTADTTPAAAFDVVTAVWGAEFIELYLELCVANQLSPGNLPALPAGSRYRILTVAEDVARLIAHPRLDAIRQLMPVDVVAVDMREADRATRSRERWNTHKRMIACHRRAAADAATEQRALIYLAPDFVLGEGTIAGLLRHHGQGARAVMTMNLRLEREAFRAALKSGNHDAALAPRELVGLGMRHLHPWTRSLMADSTVASDNPSSVYWPVRSDGALQGVLVRSLFLHPMLVDPVLRDRLPGGPIDSHYVRDCCPDVADVHVVDDSDELIVFELSPAGREIGRGVETRGVSPWRLAAVAANCDAHQLSYWRHSIRLHAGAVDGAWTSAQSDADAFARRFEQRRRFGPALVVGFEWQKRLQRKRDAAETMVRKARRRYPQLVRRGRQQGAAFAWRVRKRLRPSITVKQVTRPVKLFYHRAVKSCSLTLKRLRRHGPLLRP